MTVQRYVGVLTEAHSGMADQPPGLAYTAPAGTQFVLLAHNGVKHGEGTQEVLLQLVGTPYASYLAAWVPYDKCEVRGKRSFEQISSNQVGHLPPIPGMN